MILGDRTPWEIKRERWRIMGDDEWRSWFAWYPVETDYGVWVFWQQVEYNQPMKYNVPKYRLSHRNITQS